MNVIKLLIVMMAIACLALAACSDDAAGPGDLDDPIVDITPQPNPDGVLLSGDRADNAVGATVVLPPSAVPAADIVGGLLTTRLSAAINPAATVGDVNGVLESTGTRIVSMDEGNVFVTLKMDGVADEAAARVKAGEIRASGAFIYATPAFGVTEGLLPAAAWAIGGRSSLPPNRITPAGGTAEIAHFLKMNMPAAWNLRSIAQQNDAEITVVVPDGYSSLVAHDEIDAQDIVGFGALAALPGDVVYPGNHGYAVSGIIGANFDETPVTGANPDPGDLLEIVSLPVTGLTWTEIFWNLGWHLVGNGVPFVVNTSLGWNDLSFELYSEMERAMQVIAWRFTASIHYHEFVHVTSAGNDGGDSRMNSPFCAAHFYDDVREMVDMDALSLADSLALESVWTWASEEHPLVTAIANNVIVVGASDETGAEMASSNTPSHVRASGVWVAAPCLDEDPGLASDNSLCDGDVAHYGGTSMAAPQVAGLVAYLMNLDPDASAQEIRAIILAAFDGPAQPGFVDAWAAALALDSATDGDRRRALVDVASSDGSASPDEVFDEHDVEMILAAIEPPEPAAAVVDVPDYSRYDLNGDGYANVTTTARVDLDADGNWTTIAHPSGAGDVTFDETALTDKDVLCYFAFTDLYTGDVAQRTVLLSDCAPSLENVVVLTQEEVDAMAGVAHIDGYLRIGRNEIDTAAPASLQEDDITDLSPLSSLVSVEGTLQIGTNPELYSLAGLDNVLSVGALSLAGCANIVSPQGLGGLVDVDQIYVAYCNALTSLDGLAVPADNADLNIYLSNCPNLTDIGALSPLTTAGELSLTAVAVTDLAPLTNLSTLSRLTVRNNGSLVSLHGLENADVTGQIDITGNNALVTLASLSSVTSATFVKIFENEILTNVDGLNGINTVTDLEILSNPSLLNISGLIGVTGVSNAIRIQGNSALTSLGGLASVAGYVGTVSIRDNGELTTLSALSGITGAEWVYVIRLTKLVSVAGLQNITAGYLEIQTCVNLTSTTGLGGCVVTRDLRIQYNDKLTDVDGFHGISTLTQNLVVERNPMLASLSGLNNVHTVDGTLIVRWNTALDDCDAEAFTSGITVGGQTIVGGNCEEQ